MAGDRRRDHEPRLARHRVSARERRARRAHRRLRPRRRHLARRPRDRGLGRRDRTAAGERPSGPVRDEQLVGSRRCGRSEARVVRHPGSWAMSSRPRWPRRGWSNRARGRSCSGDRAIVEALEARGVSAAARRTRRRGGRRLPPRLRLRADEGRGRRDPGGAVLIGTNDDATYPTPTARSPVAARSSPRSRPGPKTVPVVAGKPHPPMADARARGGRRCAAADGRRPARHRRAVRRASRLRRSASCSRGSSRPTPTCRRSSRARTIVAADLADLADKILSGTG